ncbi:excinuclease ABC subunit UvrB [Sesbania bispinosa]|nr:excinuclease ABC subunit UvrB [Sesbania bispinosa]
MALKGTLKIATGSSSGVDVTAKGKIVKKKKISVEVEVEVDPEVQVMDPPQKRAQVENEPEFSILVETEWRARRRLVISRPRWDP